MATKKNVTASNLEEAYEVGFLGTVREIPDPKLADPNGAIVNSDNAPTPVSKDGPGANQPSKQDEKKA